MSEKKDNQKKAIVRSLKDIVGTKLDVAWGNGQSRRFLIENDGMGFTLSDTFINAGSKSCLQYKNHLEACYCVEGEGEVEIDGEIIPLKPGTMYALKYNKHTLTAKTDMRLICVFNPPLKGQETHDKKKLDEGSGY